MNTAAVKQLQGAIETAPEWESTPAAMPERAAMTDLGNSQRMREAYGADIRYCYQWGKFLIWTSKHWLVDETGQVMRMAKDTVRKMYIEAANIVDDAGRRALIEHAHRSESVSRLNAMIELLKSEPGIAILPDQLDANPMLLNCINGTIEQSTGNLREHRREDLLTKVCNASYKPDAPRPRLDAFLQRIFQTHPELIPFVQKVFGYGCTGLTSEQALFFLFGTGQNGKTTLVDAIMHTLGDYADKADPELLTARDGGAHPANVADLQGKRLVVCSETNEGKRFDEAKLKDLVGETRVKARFMRQDFFTFTASHKIALYSNHKPVVRGTDYGFWRRIKLIPFNEQITTEEKDLSLPAALQAEADGVLAWLVEGCLNWQREGLGLPDVVARATDGYRQEMDSIGEFISESCTYGQRVEAASKDLYEAYRGWCEDQGERPLSQKRLGAQLTERGLERVRDSVTGRYVWRGIGLRATAYQTNYPE